MAKDDKSFKELLSEAPLAAKADTVTVIGALARATEADKFELTLADGHSVTLETNAVKSFTRLGSAVGQVLVQLELDAKLLPKDLDLLKPALFQKPPHKDINKPPNSDFPTKTPYEDLLRPYFVHQKPLYSDPKAPYYDFHGTGVLDVINTGIADTPHTGVADTLGTGLADTPGDPFHTGVAAAGAAPFALATPHQAPAETLAAMMQLYARSTPVSDFYSPPVVDYPVTTFWGDYHWPWQA
jgi:hypothetical protein